MDFNVDNYTMTIRRTLIDDEAQYVGRIAEFPNVVAYEDTYEEALEILRDAVCTLKTLADEKKQPFPQPLNFQEAEYSGRVTLRIPKSLHAKLDRMALAEDVSLNQLMVTGLATYVGEADGLSRAAMVVAETVINAAKSAAYFLAARVYESKPTPITTTTIPQGQNQLLNLNYTLVPTMAGD